MKENLTYTKRRDFAWCPRYFFWRHEQRLEMIAKKPGRRRGFIFGVALQDARDSRTEGAGETEAVKRALDSIKESYETMEQAGEISSQETADDLALELVKMQVVVMGYLMFYGMRPRREVEFHLPLINPSTNGRSRVFDLAGKIDGVEIAGVKHALVIEDKLVQQIQKPMIDRLPLDAQSSEYVDAFLARGWTAEVAYRHTRWPGINPSKPKGESLDSFQRRLVEDLGERREFYFDQQILSFPTSHMDDYRLGRYGTARMIMHARRERDYRIGFPMNPTRCWEFGGCEFIPLCTQRPDAEALYQRRRDNPELGGDNGDQSA